MSQCRNATIEEPSPCRKTPPAIKAAGSVFFFELSIDPMDKSYYYKK
jgi:hypothetical protein